MLNDLLWMTFVIFYNYQNFIGAKVFSQAINLD